MVWVEISKLSKHYFYFTQQGVYLSKLDALTKLTFGCILEQRYEYECAVELLLMNQVGGSRDDMQWFESRSGPSHHIALLGGGFEAPRSESLPSLWPSTMK